MSPRGCGAPAGAGTVRAHNLALLLEHVRTREPVSRARIAESTGLTRATVSSLVEELLAGALLEELPAGRGGAGRPANPLRLNRSGPLGLGVALDPDGVRVCVVDLAGAELAHEHAILDVAASDPDTVLDAVAAMVVSTLGPAAQPVAGCGLALPGLVAADGVLTSAPNLPGWVGTAPAAALAQRLGVPVRPDNEADLAAGAELWFGGHDDLADFLHVSGEIGIGAGIVLGGRVFRGPGGRAGELGHVVVDPDGPRCRCGGRGCLELVAGMRAVCARAGVPDTDGLVAAAAAGRARTLDALGAAGRALGIAVAGAVNLLDVPAVVLGGAYARLGVWVGPVVRAELDDRARGGRPPQLLLSPLGSGAAVRGAAATVVRSLLADPPR